MTRPIFIIPCLLLITISGCNLSINPSQLRSNNAIHNNKDIVASVQDVRLKMRGMVDPICGLVETSADRIITTSNNTEVKKAAIQWKADAVPALREALFQPRPLLALFDTWVLSNQMAIYFSEGPGRSAMGSSSGMALATCLDIERKMAKTAASFTASGDVSKARGAARRWAAAHPMTSISSRQSTLGQLNDPQLAADIGAFDTLGDMTMTIDDLSRKLEVYTDQLVRQARWEADLFTMDLADRFQLKEAMPLAADAVGSVGQVSDSVDEVAGSLENLSVSVDEIATTVEQLIPIADRLAVVAEATPATIAQERAAVISAISEELGKTVEFVREEREAVLTHLTAERLAALQTLSETIISEHKTLRGEVADIATGVASESIDHSFRRLVQFAIGLLIAVTLILLAGLFLIRRMLSSLLAQHHSSSIQT